MDTVAARDYNVEMPRGSKPRLHALMTSDLNVRESDFLTKFGHELVSLPERSRTPASTELANKYKRRYVVTEKLHATEVWQIILWGGRVFAIGTAFVQSLFEDWGFCYAPTLLLESPSLTEHECWGQSLQGAFASACP